MNNSKGNKVNKDLPFFKFYLQKRSNIKIPLLNEKNYFKFRLFEKFNFKIYKYHF